MGIYIKGMEMPKSCSNCLFFVDGLYDENDKLCSACLTKKDNSPSGCGYGEIDGIDHTMGRMYWCPLVEVPTPHGRLIDADALADDLEYDAIHFEEDHEMKLNCSSWLRSNATPTVIEAEGAEE